MHRPVEDPTQTICTLQELAKTSRWLLEEGAGLYTFSGNPTNLERSYRPDKATGSVLSNIPRRGFRVSRSPAEYRNKLTMDVLDFLELATRDEGPHIGLELGPGLGVSLARITKGIQKDERLRTRGIHVFGECDQFYFKLTVLLRHLLNRSVFQGIAEQAFGKSLDSNEIYEIEREFAAVLVLYLETKEDLMESLQDSEVAARRFAEGSIWEGFLTALRSDNVPNLRRDYEEQSYKPSKEMSHLFDLFSTDPSKYFRKLRDDDKVRKHPRRMLGISSRFIILGGDMRDYIDTLPDQSLSAVWGVRSTVYIVKDPVSGRTIIPFGLKIARKLRPGGGWLDDWPRGNYDAGHHTREAVGLRQAIQADTNLSDEIRIFLIWGPSEEFPDEYPCVPVAMLMVRKNQYGEFPLQGIENYLTQHLDYGSVTRPVKYQLVEVRDDIDSLFRQGRPRPEIEHIRGRLEKQIHDMLRSLQQGVKV